MEGEDAVFRQWEANHPKLSLLVATLTSLMAY